MRAARLASLSIQGEPPDIHKGQFVNFAAVSPGSRRLAKALPDSCNSQCPLNDDRKDSQNRLEIASADPDHTIHLSRDCGGPLPRTRRKIRDWRGSVNANCMLSEYSRIHFLSVGTHGDSIARGLRRFIIAPIISVLPGARSDAARHPEGF